MTPRPGDGLDRDILDIIPERFDGDADGESPKGHAGHRIRNTLAMLLAVVGVSALVAAIWHFVDGGGPVPGGIPVIRASSSPFKEKPENSGGMRIPNQNKLVYRRMEGLPSPDTSQDHVLAGPEQPVAPPSGPAPAAPASSSETLYPGRPQMLTPQPARSSVQVPAQQAPQAEMTEAMPAAPAPARRQTKAAESPPVSASGPAAAKAETIMPAVPVRAAAPVASERRPVRRAPVEQPVAARPARTVTTRSKPQSVRHSHPQARHVAPAMTARVAKHRAEGGYVVQLAALRSLDAAKAEWRRLSRRDRALLSGLNPDFIKVRLGSKGVFWRLRAGSMSEQVAHTLCRRLAQHRQGCIVARK
jgi:hypothetical protein